MSKIANAFKDDTAFIAFLTAGDPTIDKTVEFILAMEEAGCDLVEIGIPRDNVFLTVNGRILELSDEKAEFTGNVPSGKVMVQGLGVGDVGNVVLRDRQHLAEDGLIVIAMTMDKSTGEIIAGPDVISRGFVYVKESENLMEDLKMYIRGELQTLQDEHITDWATIKSTLKDDVRDFVFSRTKRDPMILPIISEV